jgi:hypothetical protein
LDGLSLGTDLGVSVRAVGANENRLVEPVGIGEELAVGETDDDGASEEVGNSVCEEWGGFRLSCDELEPGADRI